MEPPTFTKNKIEEMHFVALANSILGFTSILNQTEEPKSSPLFSIDLPASTFIQVHGNFLYALSEQDEGSVNSYSLSSSTSPQKQSSQPVSGSPAHLSVSKNGLVGLASYNGGLVTFFKVDLKTGTIGDQVFKQSFQGSGPNKSRQTSSHPHEVVFSNTNSRVYIPDLGTDEIHRFDSTDFSKRIPSIKVKPGYGPRHLKIVGDLMLVVCELVSKLVVVKSDVVVAEYDLIDTSTSTPTSSGSRVRQRDKLQDQLNAVFGTAAEIQVVGSNVYVSQRMVDSYGVLVHFHLDTATDSLSLVQRYHLQGKSPRHFAINGNQVFVALEDQAFIEVFSLNPADGSLATPSSKANVGAGQKCVAFSKM